MKQDCETDLFYLLHDVAHLMRIGFDQWARAWGMTRAQCVILIRLHKQPGMTQTEMAAICEIEPITVARLVDRLQASGYVERRSDPNDRRINRLHLLPAAAPLIEKIKQSRQTAIEELSGDMDPEIKEAAVTALIHMKRKLTSGCLSNLQSCCEGKEP